MIKKEIESSSSEVQEGQAKIYFRNAGAICSLPGDGKNSKSFEEAWNDCDMKSLIIKEQAREIYDYAKNNFQREYALKKQSV